jgi:CNT family concentrative nucleoside transporter
MQLARGALGIAVVLGLCLLLSRNRRAISSRVVLCGLGLQVLLGLLVFLWPSGEAAVGAMSRFVVRFLEFSYAGSSFVFGSLGMKATGPEDSHLAFQALPILVYFSAVMAILYHFGIMQAVVWVLARGLGKLLRVSGAEAMAVTANIFIGMTEAPLVIRPYLEKMTTSELLAVMTGGFATIAGTVMGIYMLFIGEAYAGYILAASVMAAPAAFVTSKIILPETESPETGGGMRLTIERSGSNVLDAIALGVKDGLHLALNIAAMLIAFYSLVALLNWPLEAWLGTTIQSIIGHVLSPFAWCLGVRWEDAPEIGSLLGTKIALNEWIAYQDLQGMIARGAMDDRSIKIATFALSGFANLGSIGVTIGGISQLAPSRRPDLARLAFPAMIAGALSSCLTAAIAGMFA